MVFIFGRDLPWLKALHGPLLYSGSFVRLPQLLAWEEVEGDEGGEKELFKGMI